MRPTRKRGQSYTLVSTSVGTYKKGRKDGEVLFDGLIHDYIYSYNPPVDDSLPHYDTSAPRVSGWSDPGNTTGWADAERKEM